MAGIVTISTQVPYELPLQFHPVTGPSGSSIALTLFTASPATATTWIGATAFVRNYETLTVPPQDLSNSIATITKSEGIALLQKNTAGYLLTEILPTTPGAAQSDPTDTNTSTDVPPIKPTGVSSKVSTTRGSSPPTTSPAIGKAGSDNKAPIAAAGAMGGLFAIALVALLFLIFKLRKARKDSFHSPPMMAFAESSAEKDQSPISELSAANMNLMSQLEERNAQLSTLQATLMRSNSVPPSLDDRSIASRFKQLEQELKDWVIIHFKSMEQRLDLSPQLREILISQIPLFDRLLQQPKSRTMVLRVVAGHVIQKAFENGEFVGVGEGLGSLERSVGRNIPEAEFNKWRSQTFLIFSKASTAESKADVVAAISQRIDSLLSPFSTTLDQQERLHFLYRIVESAAALSLDLGYQLAKFKVLSDPAETPFDSAHMEDVYQEHETQVDSHTGKSVNALDGKIIQAVVFPSVIKWGDERGENYEEMKVILKAKVLT